MPDRGGFGVQFEVSGGIVGQISLRFGCIKCSPLARKPLEVTSRAGFDHLAVFIFCSTPFLCGSI